MDAIETALKRLRQIDGLVGASVIGVPSGELLGHLSEADEAVPDRRNGGDPQSQDPDDGSPGDAARIVAGAATDVLRAVSLLNTLQPQDGSLEDVVITLSGRHHLVRPLGDGADGLLLLVTLDRERTNLALARRQLREAEADLGG